MILVSCRRCTKPPMPVSEMITHPCFVEHEKKFRKKILLEYERMSKQLNEIIGDDEESIFEKSSELIDVTEDARTSTRLVTEDQYIATPNIKEISTNSHWIGNRKCISSVSEDKTQSRP